MPLTIPVDSNPSLATWAHELVLACHSDLEERRQRGAVYRNIYLTGDEGGVPQTYKKTYTYIQTLATLLYSPVELRFAVSPYGPAGPRERAMGRASADTLLEYMRNGNIDTTIEDAVEWSLVKGKTFIKMGWSRRGLQAYMVQPETMGVLRPDLKTLDQQDAFVHSTWMTEARFADLIENHPKKRELLAKARGLANAAPDRPDIGDNSRQVVIGGQLYPFRARGTSGAGQGRGLVNWLSGPMPELDARTLAKLIRLDELWVWDRMRDDWTTFQLIGDLLIEPTAQHRNLFAEGDTDTRSGRKVKLGQPANENEPLTGHHPFIEICANPMPDYFWGWSEVTNVAYLQTAINRRMDGINRMLRLQEDNPTLISGANTPVGQLRSKLRRPGGWHVEQQGMNLKVEKFAPVIGPDLWNSLHELVDIFDSMAGFPPVMQGQGEAGVRAQGHAETLVRMASPRFKDRALGIERQVEEVGGLALDILRSHLPDALHYWVKEGEVGPFKGQELDPMAFEPPAPNLVALPYQMALVNDRFKVTVDAHTGSPIFSKDTRELAVLLSQRGAITPEDLIRMTHPDREQELIADWETRQAAQAAFLSAHPEILTKGKGRQKL